MINDFEQCYRAVRGRDARFDGRFVTAVLTTGIFCRPSCPAQTPRPANVRFYPVPAAAQAAGFRACKRCRPDSTPGSPEWDVRADLAGRALRLIGEGVVDDAGVSGLAGRLAVSERHLHRLLTAEVGAGPLALARTRRAQTARMLVESTAMPLTDVAFTAGYHSVRQFNDSFRDAFGLVPSGLRRSEPGGRPPGTGAITLRLRYRPPYDGTALIDWLAARAVPGLERVEDGTYQRTMRLPRSTAVVELTPTDAGHVVFRARTEDLRDLAVAVARVRRLADLDADPTTIDETLAADPMLAPLVASRPGLRVPGSVDGFELACRAVLGQQVTVAGARTLAGRLVTAFGDQLPIPAGDLTHLFPTPDAIAAADPEELAVIGLTGARARTLRTLAKAVTGGAVRLDPGADRDDTRRALLALPGIGPWTAAYVAMRGLGDPDAIPVHDLGLRKASVLLGGPGAPAAIGHRAARWRPWRSYGAMRLWSALSDLGEGAGSARPDQADRSAESNPAA